MKTMDEGRPPTSQNSDESRDATGPPPNATRWQRIWWWIDLIALANIARLRFLAMLVVIGVVLTQWDAIVAVYERMTRPAGEAKAAEAGVEWFCPMHPAIVRDNGKEKCPICFMPLAKRKKGGPAEPLPAGITSRVQLSPYRVVLAGIQTWHARPLPLVREIQTVGYVEFNEENQRTISARVAGRIDKLYANQTGQMVNEGDDLALLYSPNLLVAMQSLLEGQRSNRPDLVESSRSRLRLLDIDDRQINEILAEGKDRTHWILRSPFRGHVIKKNVVEGQYVEEGAILFELADLSSVWIQAQVYEDDVPFLQIDHSADANGTRMEGADVRAFTTTFPDEPFTAKRAFVFPHVNPATRTVTLRIELENPGHKLRPGSTATVVLRVPAAKMPMFAESAHKTAVTAEGAVLCVPESSVIDTGSQTIVYRETAPGTFEGVLVVLGPRMADESGALYFPVLSGIEEGDRIVTSGSFLIDAETRLNPAAGSIYFGGGGGSEKPAGTSSVVRPTTPEDPRAVMLAALDALEPADREIALRQRYCPVLKGSELGSMGTPVRVTIEGKPVFLCCKGCVPKAEETPALVLKQALELRRE